MEKEIKLWLIKQLSTQERQSYWYGCLRDVESWQEHWEHCSVLQQQTRIYVTLLIHVLIWNPPGNQGLWVYFGRLFETLSFYQSLLKCPSITIMTTVNWSSWHFLWKQWAVSFISYIAIGKLQFSSLWKTFKLFKAAQELTKAGGEIDYQLLWM